MPARFPVARLPDALLPHDRELVVGKTGTGKSSAVKAQIGRLCAAGARVCAFDFHDEYSQLGRETQQVKLGPLRARVTIEQLTDDPSLLDDTRLSLAVVPRREPEQAAEDFCLWVDLLFETGDLIAAADEIGTFGPFCQRKLDFIATQGRHESIPIIFAAQRLTQIPKTARTQCSILVSFRQDNPDDLAALSDINPADKTFADRVAALPRGQCEIWRDEPDPRGGRKDEKQ